MRNRINIQPIIAAVLLAAFSVAAANAQARLALPRPAVSGVYIEDLANGEVIADINGDRPFVPASITKAFTSASALSTIGGDYRFETRVNAVGAVEDSVLNGDIVIGVSGDPTLESEHFEDYAGFADSIAAGIRTLGIRAVNGEVRIDKGGFVDEPTPAGWMEEDLAWPYGSGHFGASFRDNKFVLSMPGKRSNPHVPSLKVSHTAAKGALSVKRRRGSDTFHTRGRLRKKGASTTLANPDPGATMVHEIRHTLSKSGIAVKNLRKTTPGENADTLEIYTHVSPPLVDILRSLMFRSDNMMAEGVLRLLAPGKSRKEAVESEIELWQSRDLDTELIELEDGSGLSRDDRLTPYFMADILAWMAESDQAALYASLFPKAGLDGTLKGFLTDTELEGRLALKTGSMKGVQSFAGYLLDNDGNPTHAVIVMVNDFTCARAKVKSAIQQLLLSLLPSPQP